MGARARAGKLGACASGPVAEGLCSLSPDRRESHRRRRRVGDIDARRREAAMVERSSRGGRRSFRVAAATFRIAGNLLPNFRRGRRGDRTQGRHSGRGGSRRSSGRRGGNGNRAPGRSKRDDRHVGRRFCGDGSSGARSARPAAYILPCDSRPLAHHGRDAGRRIVSAVVPRPLWRGRRQRPRSVRAISSRSSIGSGWRRRAFLGALLDGRAYAAPRSKCARRAGRPNGVSRARARHSRDSRGRRVQPEGYVFDF